MPICEIFAIRSAKSRISYFPQLISVFKILLRKVNERMHYHPCVLAMSSSVYTTGVCV